MHERDRFDKFTERAGKVLQLAQEEAQRLLHNYIVTVHLLLGLVREAEGVAGIVLTSLGVDLEKVRKAVEDSMGRGVRRSITTTENRIMSCWLLMPQKLTRMALLGRLF